MKKKSIFSGLILTALIVFAACAFKQQPSNLTGFWVDVIGCDECDNISYCLNNGPAISVNSTHFYVECDPASEQQKICVTCCGDKYGTVTLVCGSVPGVKVKVSNASKPCNCSNKK
ncbi:MAG: hypothetical protein PHN88_10295 [Ignavibacteria bacterium]|nr:hypothetical protein [Ignavibacteria bacterium]